MRYGFTLPSLAAVSLLLTPLAAFADGQEIGQACDVFSPCRDGAQCIPTPWIGAFQQRCVPEEGNPLDAVSCQAFYSRTVHDDVIAELSGGAQSARTFGGGAEVAGIGVASAEIGTAYGEDGRYGCYTSTCTGVGFALGISAFGSIGTWDSWEVIEGDSQWLWSGAGAIVSFVAGPVTSPGLGTIGFVAVGSVGFGVDAGVGTANCSTSLLTIVSPDDVYVDIGYSGASNGSALAPYKTFDEGYTLSKSLNGSTPKMTLRSSGGEGGTIAAGNYNKSIVITADEGPVTLSAN